MLPLSALYTLCVETAIYGMHCCVLAEVWGLPVQFLERECVGLSTAQPYTGSLVFCQWIQVVLWLANMEIETSTAWLFTSANQRKPCSPVIVRTVLSPTQFFSGSRSEVLIPLLRTQHWIPCVADAAFSLYSAESGCIYWKGKWFFGTARPKQTI